MPLTDGELKLVAHTRQTLIDARSHLSPEEITKARQFCIDLAKEFGMEDAEKHAEALYHFFSYGVQEGVRVTINKMFSR